MPGSISTYRLRHSLGKKIMFCLQIYIHFLYFSGNANTCRQISNHSTLRDITWSTHNCLITFDTIGIFFLILFIFFFYFLLILKKKTFFQVFGQKLWMVLILPLDAKIFPILCLYLEMILGKLKFILIPCVGQK